MLSLFLLLISMSPQGQAILIFLVANNVLEK